MATAAMGIWNHHAAAAQSLKATAPMAGANTNDGSSTASSDSATISANDFLTLLVTEMKNQDPTANTDPNEYINQLVQVNSLEQLISINQTLTTDSGSSTTPSAVNASTSGAIASALGPKDEDMTASAQNNSAVGGGGASSLKSAAAISQPHQALARHAPGNLSIPEANRSAQRVARSLGGRTAAL
jgi:flagellar basal-body rod modification protein FlgD